MSGFSGIVGFIFTFMVLMTVFVGGFYMFLDQVATQEDLFRTNVDQTVQTLREEFNIENIFLNSGRIQLDILNLGKDKLIFKQGENECFEYFIGPTYVTDNNIELKTFNNLGGNYFFIDSGNYALVYLLYNSLIPGSETVKLISCLGNKGQVELDSNIVNWYDNEFNNRENLNLGSNSNDRTNALISHSLTSSDYNTTFFENGKLSYFCPIRNFEILNLPFDDYSQNLKDYSINDESVTLGNFGSIETVDPKGNGGVILKGLDFNATTFISSLNFEFDDSPSTISFWFKSNSTLDSSSPVRTFFNVSSEYIIAHNYLGLGEIGFYRVDTGSGTRTFELVSTSRSFKSSTWYNVIFVLDGSNTHSFYLNGDLESTTNSNLVGGVATGLVVGAVE